MSEKSIPVITINREYGACGRSLAVMLSEKLGIPYYDKEFVKKTVTESGYDKEDVEREGEEISEASDVINKLFNTTVSYKSSYDSIFDAEKKVILEYAKSPCIMIGRCADRILAEAGIDRVSIYMHAPLETRLKRALELKEYGDTDPVKFVEKVDSGRRNYYKKYTGAEINDAANYTFCFDVSKVSVSFCADTVINLIKQA